ncbi:MAG: D-alanine aminotransferase [Legionellaceae bacterium]
MTIAYLNNEFLPLEKARVSAMDRGFLFGDGAYEVIPVYQGKPFRLNAHFARLENSLREIYLEKAINRELWQHICNELIKRNGGNCNQSIYLQITRGYSLTRQHAFNDDLTPTFFAFSKALDNSSLEYQGIKVITLPDIRWKNCNIKAITLLANVLQHQKAKEAGAAEAILINNGFAVEGTASNLFIVKEGILITPPLNSQILGGVTRDYILDLAKFHGMPYLEQPISENEIFMAQEVWLTSSTKEIQPVIRIDNHSIGDGKPGKLWQQMIHYYQHHKNDNFND